MSKPKLRVILCDEPEHPLDIAKRKVKEHEESKQSKEPVTNIHGPEKGRAPSLDVDEVIRKSQPDHIGRKVKGGE